MSIRSADIAARIGADGAAGPFPKVIAGLIAQYAERLLPEWNQDEWARLTPTHFTFEGKAKEKAVHQTGGWGFLNGTEPLSRLHWRWAIEVSTADPCYVGVKARVMADHWENAALVGDGGATRFGFAGPLTGDEWPLLRGAGAGTGAVILEIAVERPKGKGSGVLRVWRRGERARAVSISLEGNPHGDIGRLERLLPTVVLTNGGTAQVVEPEDD